MAITSDGWVDWARRVPGVPDKVYSKRNSMAGLIGHSIVGSIESALGRFLNEDGRRAANGDWVYSNYAAASCVFLISYEGELIQMYPIWASTWTSGGYEVNTTFVPIEMEGGLDPFSEPLTDAQVATTMRLTEEFEAYTGRKIVRGTTFREHGEIAREYDYAPTACPSGRYARFYQALEEREMGMTPEEQQAFADLHLRVTLLSRIVVENGLDAEFMGEGFPTGVRDRVIALFPENAEVGKVYRLAGKNAFDFAVLLGHSYALGLRNTQLNVTKHVQLPHVRADHLHDEKYAKIGYAHKVVIE